MDKIIFIVVCLLLLGLNSFNLQGIFSKKLNLKNKKILLILAHPDDEMAIAGTLANAKYIDAIYLTCGEDGPTSGIVDKKDLKDARKKELQQVSRILNYHQLYFMNYPDRYLNTVGIPQILEEIQQKVNIDEYDAIVSFDTEVGLYGHSDHIHCGKVSEMLFNQNDVEILIQMNLSSIQIAAALKLSKTFKQNYKHPLPKVTHSQWIFPNYQKKMKVIQCHKTQQEVVEDVFPFINKVPTWLYFCIFSMEYFHVRRKKD